MLKVYSEEQRPGLGNCWRSRDPVQPLLLQRYAEYRRPANSFSHHVQEIANAGTFLNIVGQVKVGIVQFVIVDLRARRRSAKKKEHGHGANNQQPLRALQEKHFHICTFRTVHIPMASYFPENCAQLSSSMDARCTCKCREGGTDRTRKIWLRDDFGLMEVLPQKWHYNASLWNDSRGHHGECFNKGCLGIACTRRGTEKRNRFLI